jgi:hypothetical protein
MGVDALLMCLEAGIRRLSKKIGCQNFLLFDEHGNFLREAIFLPSQPNHI